MPIIKIIVPTLTAKLTLEINIATVPAMNKKGARKLPRIGNMIGKTIATIVEPNPMV